MAVGAGKVFVIPGARSDSLPPNVENVAPPISNHSISGSGDYLVNLATGSPYLTPEVGSRNALSNNAWYRFTTLGDGLPGNSLSVVQGPQLPISINPQAVGDTAHLGNNAGAVVSITQTNRAIFEFNLSNLLSLQGSPDTSIASASLNLDYTSNGLAYPATFDLSHDANKLSSQGMTIPVGHDRQYVVLHGGQ